jgi:aconitase B
LDEDLPELIEWQKEKVNLLTAEQCQIIVEYLEITLKVREGIEKGYQDDTKTLNFWRENHQKTLTEAQNLNKW